MRNSMAIASAFVAVLFVASCWRMQTIPSDRDTATDTETETESGGMTDPETDPMGYWDWTVMSSDTVNQLSGVWGFDADNVFAVGKHGTIVHWDGDEWDLMEFPQAAPGQDLGDITGLSSGDLIAVGASGTILRNDGMQWYSQPSGHEADLHGVCANTEYEMFAVGSEGTVLFGDGFGWVTVAAGADYTLMSAACSAQTGGYAVGHNNSSGMSSVLLQLNGYLPMLNDHPIAHFMYAISHWEGGQMTAIAGLYQESEPEGPYFGLYTRQEETGPWALRVQGEALILDMEEKMEGDINNDELFMAGRTLAEGAETEYPVILLASEIEDPMVYTHDTSGSFRAIWQDNSKLHGDVFAVGDNGLIVRGEWVQP